MTLTLNDTLVLQKMRSEMNAVFVCKLLNISARSIFVDLFLFLLFYSAKSRELLFYTRRVSLLVLRFMLNMLIIFQNFPLVPFFNLPFTPLVWFSEEVKSAIGGTFSQLREPLSAHDSAKNYFFSFAVFCLDNIIFHNKMYLVAFVNI